MEMQSPTALLIRKNFKSEEDKATLERADAIYAMLPESEQDFIHDLAQWYSSIRFEIIERPHWLWNAYLRVVGPRAFFKESPGLLDYVAYPVAKAIGRKEMRRSDEARKAFLQRIRRASGEHKRGLTGALTYLRVIGFSISAKDFRADFDEITDSYVRSGRVPEADRIEALRFAKELEDRHMDLCRAYNQNKKAKKSSAGEAEGREGKSAPIKAATGSDPKPAPEVAPDAPPSTPWEFLLKLTREDPEKAIEVAQKQWKSAQEPGEFSQVQLMQAYELAYELAVFFKPHFEAFALHLLDVSVTWTGRAVSKASRVERSAQFVEQFETRATLFADWIESLRRREQPIALEYLLTMLRYGNPSRPYWDSILDVSYAQAVNAAAHDQESCLELFACVSFYAEAGSALAENALAQFEKLASQALDSANEIKAGFDATRDLTGAIKLVEEKTMSGRNLNFAANPDHPLVMIVRQRLKHTIGEILSTSPSNVMELMAHLMTQVRVEVLFRELDASLRKALAARLRSFPADAAKALIHLTRYCGYSQVDDEEYRKHVCKATFNEFYPVLRVVSPDDADLVRPHIGWSPSRDVF